MGVVDAVVSGHSIVADVVTNAHVITVTIITVTIITVTVITQYNITITINSTIAIGMITIRNTSNTIITAIVQCMLLIIPIHIPIDIPIHMYIITR